MAAFNILVQAVQNSDFEGKQKQVACGVSLKKPYHSDWLEKIVGGKFFAICKPHFEKKQNGRNVFCIDCGQVICPSCMPSHSKCRMLQIFRHCHRDVVREKDFCKVFDTTGVQQMFVNLHKVVNLKTRADPSPTKHGSTIVCHCEFCDHAMQAQYAFCSVDCKIKAARARNGTSAVSALVRHCDKLPEIKIRTSSPRTTKYVPVDEDDDAIPTPTPAPRTTKRIRKSVTTPPKKTIPKTTIPGTHTDESEVEDMDTAFSPTPFTMYAPDNVTPELEIVTPVNYLSPPRRMRSPRRKKTARHHPYLPPSNVSPPEVEAAPEEAAPTPPPSPSGNMLSRVQRKGKPFRSCTPYTCGALFPAY